MEYYHITPIENKESIVKNGLMLGTVNKFHWHKTKGRIFLFDDVEISYPECLFRYNCKWNNNLRLIPLSDIIANSQLHLSEYSLFKVETDLTVFPDICGESLVQDHQYYVKEPIKNVEYIGDFQVGKYYDYELLKEKYHIPAGYKICQASNGGNMIVPFGWKPYVWNYAA